MHPVEVLTARVAERNRTLPAGAPRIDPALVASWDDRIERPDADELALFDSPTEPRPAPGGSAVRELAQPPPEGARSA
jgi:hypothetical protein